jgi:hypothetical protein
MRNSSTDFIRKSKGRSPFGRTALLLKSKLNIKMNLEVARCGVWIGLIWLRITAICGLLLRWY